MTGIVIIGSKGRMGRAIRACVERMPGLRVTGEADQGDELLTAVGSGDVVVEFSAHTVTPVVAELCADQKKPLVIGTTGHNQAEKAQIAGGHAHRFRDTFAVELLLAGVPMERVSILLGHRTIRVTEKHYAPWVRARQEQLEADVRRAWGNWQSPTKGTPEVHGNLPAGKPLIQ